MTTRPMTIAELAERLGYSTDWFYRKGNLDKLYAEGLPRPLAKFSMTRRRWDRASVEAWLGRHHPAEAVTGVPMTLADAERIARQVEAELGVKR